MFAIPYEVDTVVINRGIMPYITTLFYQSESNRSNYEAVYFSHLCVSNYKLEGTFVICKERNKVLTYSNE
jgi:hypothetical protein